MGILRAIHQATLCFATACAVLAGTAHGSAQVRIVENVETYPVTGLTGADMIASVRARKFSATGSRHPIAVTQVNIEPGTLDRRIRGRQCHVERAEIVLTLTYTYPIWVDAARGSPQLRKVWEDFTAELARHETRHAEIAVERANKVHRVYSRAKSKALPDGSCANFGENHRRKLERLKRSAQIKHIKFDRRDQRANARLRRLIVALQGAR